MIVKSFLCILTIAISLLSANGQSSNVVNFDLNFDLGEFVTVGGMEYVLTDFKVTSGTSHDLHVGQRFSFAGSNGDFNFKINRHGSTEPASWLWERINFMQSTVVQEATSLNFALEGDLYITLLDFFGSETILIKKVYLFQQNIITANVWYMGGADCLSPVAELTSIRCTGESEDRTVRIRFFLREWSYYMVGDQFEDRSRVARAPAEMVGNKPTLADEGFISARISLE